MRIGDSLPLSLHGTPGEQVYLAADPQPSHVLDLPPLQGVLLVAPSFRRVVCGTVAPDGSSFLPLSTPAVPGGAANDLMHIQPILVDELGGARLGCASVIVRVATAP